MKHVEINGKLVALKVERPKHKPVKMELAGAEGSRVVLSTAKKVIETHRAVIKALANR